MRYADASRAFSFLLPLVVASDVVFFFTHFFRPRSLPGFLAGIIPRVDGACEEDDEDETGGAEGVWGLV